LNKINLSKVIALSITFLVFVFSFLLISFFSDCPLKIESNNTSYAVIAIRDNVNSFQKFGTKLFTTPYLNKYYKEVAYFTQDSCDDKHNEFVKKLDSLLRKYQKVDIFLLAHSNFYYKWVSEIDSAKRKNIRLVYNTGCSDNRQSEIWLNLGAKSYVAHEGVKSISPAFYFFFLRRWGSGDKLINIVKASNEIMHTKLSRISFTGINEIDIKESEGIIYGDTSISINK